MNIKKAAASFLFMIFAMVCNVSMAFASWGGMGYKNCVLCGALVTPMPTYGGTQKYTEFYNCEEVEGLTSSTTQRYALKNMYVVSNADGVICTNCVERISANTKAARAVKLMNQCTSLPFPNQ